MFIAMNRFRVTKGSEAAFENVWMSRDSHLDKEPGFVEFHLLKGPEAEDHTLYGLGKSCCVRGMDQIRGVPRRALVAQATCIWIIRSSRGLRFARRWDAASRCDAYMLNGVREHRRCPLLGKAEITWKRRHFRF
jgi:hypothetical protein